MHFPGIRLIEQKFRRIRVCLEEKQNEIGTSQVGAISTVQKAQFLKYAQDVFMKNSCFRTSASSSLKRNIVRI